VGPVAQLVEQGTFNPKVAGSSPARPIETDWTASRPVPAPSATEAPVCRAYDSTGGASSACRGVRRAGTRPAGLRASRPSRGAHPSARRRCRARRGASISGGPGGRRRNRCRTARRADVARRARSSRRSRPACNESLLPSCCTARTTGRVGTRRHRSRGRRATRLPMSLRVEPGALAGSSRLPDVDAQASSGTPAQASYSAACGSVGWTSRSSLSRRRA
jgi:hypothetical protein